MTIRPETGALIEFLDSLAKIDPVATGRLVGFRVPCNAALGDHPSVQVGSALMNEHRLAAEDRDVRPFSPVVGVLGILNGFAGTYDSGPFTGWGPIAATVEDDGSVTGFKLTAPLEGMA